MLLDSEEEDISRETLEMQFNAVTMEITSPPDANQTATQWGDMKMKNDYLTSYFGSKKNTKPVQKKKFNWTPICMSTAVPSPEISKYIIERNIESAKTKGEAKKWKIKLNQLMQERQKIDVLFNYF